MRQFALIATKFAVSALLLYFAISRINFTMIGERLSRLDVSWLFFAIAIGLVQTGLNALRWQRIVVLCGGVLRPPRACRFNLIAAFFNQVLPSTVGGDAARIVLLYRDGTELWKATYSVLLDRFIGVLALAALVTGGLYWSFALIPNATGRIVLLVIGLGSLAAGAAFLALGLLPWFAKWTLTRRLAEMSVLARHILSTRGVTIQIALLSFLIHLMTTTVIWSTAQAIDARLGFADAFLLVLPVMLIATIPISIAGWGVRETALVLAFSYAGLPASDGLIISVLFGSVMFVIGVIGGVVWLASPEKRLRILEASDSKQLPT